jgi:hypothetical protein
MCKTKVLTKIYYDKVRKCKHENNIIRIWCKIVIYIGVEEIKGNMESYFYLYPFGDLIQRSFHGDFSMCSSTKEYFKKIFDYK